MQTHKPSQHAKQQGQSMVEYTLIVVLLVFAFAVAIAATGPAIGNVFSNTVYNLLGTDPDDINDLPSKDAFWLTVTWVSQQTPVEEPLPTRTKVPATATPTDGPSPTWTPTVPTNTPEPTWTPSPSPTPEDLEFVAPWHDSADDADHWRIGGSVFLGADEGWYAEYFADTSLTSSSAGQYTSEIDESKTYDLDFNWGSGAPIEPNWPAGNDDNYFGVSFRREIFLENELTLLFNLENIDDGVRFWLLPGHGDITTTRPGNCSDTGVTWGGSPSGSSLIVYDDDAITADASLSQTECLLLNGWGNNNGKTTTVRRTVPAGAYTLVVDMFDNTGNARIKMSVDAVGFGGNSDDTTVDSSGNPDTGAPDCRWNATEDLKDSNSADNRWDAWDGWTYGAGNRCYLELRGSIEIPSGMTEPVLTFWDVWDFRDPSMQAWVEIADYDPDSDGIFDRDDLVWTQQLLHTGNSTNYNWTYQRIDLRALLGLATMEGKKYAIRFGMEVPAGVNYTTGWDRGWRLWWVDSINIDQEPQATYYLAPSNPITSYYMNMSWDMDTVEQADDFITSGRWELTSSITRGGGGLAWDDSPFEDYQDTELDGCGHSSSGCTEYDNQNLRMHTIEFNGVVDLDNPIGATDVEGDTGDAMLTFWHAFDIDRRTGLEIQYTTDLTYDSGDAPLWNVVPGGQLNPRDSSGQPRQTAMTFVEINLEELKALEPSANGKFRIRFALTAGQDASQDPGWWIDDIKLERASIANFLPYPYIETFEQEETSNDWLLGGSWDRADNRAYRPISGTGTSLTDSPYSKDGGGNVVQETYATNQTSTAELRLALDVNNDSPMNPFSPACALIPSDPCDEPDNDLPVDPIMTFQWWHDFGSSGGEHFYVDWKKADGDDSSWQELWAYRDAMSYFSSSDGSTRRQWNWQRVEIDLRQIWASGSFDNGIPDATTDDDILFRFRFSTNGNNNGADGVYIDELKIVEREEKSFTLWDEGVSQDVDNADFPSNEPLIYTTGSYRYVRFIADSEVNGNSWATIAEFNLLDENGDDIPLDASMIESFSSERADNGDDIEDMLDNDTTTQWFSQVNPSTASHPHEFVIDMNTGHQVSFFTIMPRQLDPSNSNYENGWILDYRVFVSNNGSTWELAKDAQLAKTALEQTIALQIDYTSDSPPADSGNTVSVAGNGVSYRDNLDDRANDLFDNWYLGGTWEVIEWEQYDGVLAFHDSTSTPLNSSGDDETPPPNPTTYTRNSGRSYNVLEMATIIDLRGTDANRLPIMTFWQRHHIGSSTRILVQIAHEDPDTIGDSSHCFSSSRDQCYEHLYGWSSWETAPPWGQSGYNDWNKSGERRQYLWKREIVDLSPYAASGGDDGKRIRIRFVSESMDRSPGDGNLKDGWYIDNLEFKYNIPSVVNIDTDTGQSFFDAARNLRNWLAEGQWGLSPEFFRGSGGGPADFGGSFWNYSIYNMNDCPNDNNGYRNCVRNRFNSWNNQSDGAAYRIKTGIALDINNDWGDGGPTSQSSKFAGIWEITTPVIGTTMTAGNYTFVFTYDEALRVKYDTVPGGNLPLIEGVIDPYDPEWNIFDDFNVGGRQVNIGNALFETGEQYKIRMEFFERWGDAALIVSLGSSSFSFTDSPKQASGPAFDEVPAAPRSESSLIFNGVFDLKDAVAPIMQYYTYHELGGAARVEVTTDGGFLWRQTGLAGTTPVGFWTSDWDALFWDDSARVDGGRMAYDPNTGRSEFGTYPPTATVPSYYDGDFNFSWGGSPYAGIPSNNWSGQFRREFTLAADREVTFTVRSDDGHRLWIDYTSDNDADPTSYFDQCAFLDNDPAKPFVSGKPLMSGENDEVIDDNTNSTSCILISDWEDGGSNFKQGTRIIPAGTHEVVMDFYENTGGQRLQLDVLVGDYDNPNYGGTYMPNNGDWREKVHSLEYYAGYEADGDPKPPIGLRFRLDRLGESETGNYQQRTNQSPTNWMESWWVTDITIVDTVSG